LKFWNNVDWPSEQVTLTLTITVTINPFTTVTAKHNGDSESTGSHQMGLVIGLRVRDRIRDKFRVRALGFRIKFR